MLIKWCCDANCSFADVVIGGAFLCAETYKYDEKRFQGPASFAIQLS